MDSSTNTTSTTNTSDLAAKAISALSERLQWVDAENATLRGLLAKGQGDCVYCQLPADQIAKCKFGFPGCGRMDDVINGYNTENESRLENRIVDLVNDKTDLALELDRVKRELVNRPYEVLSDLRMYMQVAEVKNPLIMIDEYMAKRHIIQHTSEVIFPGGSS